MHFFFFSVCCKKQTSSVKRINLITDDGLYDRKAFYKVKIVFVHPLYLIVNLSNINILLNRVADVYGLLKSITSKLHNKSVSIGFIKKQYLLM